MARVVLSHSSLSKKIPNDPDDDELIEDNINFLKINLRSSQTNSKNVHKTFKLRHPNSSGTTSEENSDDEILDDRTMYHSPISANSRSSLQNSGGCSSATRLRASRTTDRKDGCTVEFTTRELELRVRSPSTVRRFRFNYDPKKDTPQSVATEIVQFLKIPPKKVHETTVLTCNHISNLLQISSSQNVPSPSSKNFAEPSEEKEKFEPIGNILDPNTKLETLRNLLEFTLSSVGNPHLFPVPVQTIT